MSNFDRMFDLVACHEGGFTDNAADPGNWTGGAIGAGLCRGTKFGISAAAYPELDIAGITLDAAKEIYRHQIAARPDGIAALSAEFLAQRLAFMATLPTWRVFGLGWARRLCRLPYQALAIAS